MNRRDIFKLIGGALCAASIELTGVVPRMPKVKVNPAYATAQYEEIVMFNSDIFHNKIDWHESHKGIWSPAGPRYNFVDGKWVKVEPTLPADG